MKFFLNKLNLFEFQTAKCSLFLSVIAARKNLLLRLKVGILPARLVKYDQWRNWVKTWAGACSRLLFTDISVIREKISITTLIFL